MSSWTARAPGKIIFSGEHAVLYGAPALALAVNRHATVRATSSGDQSWKVSLPGLGERRLEGSELARVADVVDQRYADFTSGKLPITEVLTHPTELILYALSMLIRDHGLRNPDGLHLALESSIPLGGGMGSSAAVILCALAAAGPALGIELSRDQLYPLALRAERIQHGQSSGLDPYVCLHGGLVRFRHKEPTRLETPAGLRFTLVFTGKPDSGTGECVESVRQHWGKHSIWGDFAGVTLAVEKALLGGSAGALKAAVRVNHRLLNSIGVVPAPVARFIREIEARNGAAKVCGAGAVRGNAGGIVLVLVDGAIDDLVAQAGYTQMVVEPEPHGVRNG